MRIDTGEEGRSQLQALLQENLKLSKAILHSVEKTNRHILLGQIANWLRLFLILIPIALAALYIPPLIKKFQENPAAFFGNVLSDEGGSAALMPERIQELQRLLEQPR
ncbi:MAG: hypothetical protein AAB562_03780 [Patescibacteria group bacterium]